MEEIIKKDVTMLLCYNYDVVAYRLIDMKEVSKDVIKYKLNMKKEPGQ